MSMLWMLIGFAAGYFAAILGIAIGAYREFVSPGWLARASDLPEDEASS